MYIPVPQNNLTVCIQDKVFHKRCVQLLLLLMYVQAAQEREELQVAGDALDARISKAEAEVAMLSNTLNQMQATNTAFSSSLRQGDTKATLQERNALRCGSLCDLGLVVAQIYKHHMVVVDSART